MYSRIDCEIKIGSVIRTYSEVAGKIKRMIVVGFDDEQVLLAAIFINSKFNQNHFRTKVLQDDLLLFTKDEKRNYLDRDSFIDCSELHPLPIADIASAIASEPNIIIGDVQDRDMLQIKNKIKNSKNIKARDKKRFGLFY